MVGAPVNIRLNPLKALAVYVSGKVAVQIICEPETSSEPSNARVPAGNSTPEVTDTGPIGLLQIPDMLQKVVSSGKNKTAVTSDPSRSARAIVGEKTANASVTAIPICADFRRILSLSPFRPGFPFASRADGSIHLSATFEAVESKFFPPLESQ
jgi:hypothetical protein